LIFLGQTVLVCQSYNGVLWGSPWVYLKSMHREVQITYYLMTRKCKKAIKIAIFHVSSPSGIFLGFYSTCTCDSLMPTLNTLNLSYGQKITNNLRLMNEWSSRHIIETF